MNLDTFTTILVVIAPAVTAMATIIGGIIKIAKNIKKLELKMLDMFESKVNKLNTTFDDIAILKAKIESIEKHMLEQKKEKK